MPTALSWSHSNYVQLGWETCCSNQAQAPVLWPLDLRKNCTDTTVACISIKHEYTISVTQPIYNIYIVLFQLTLSYLQALSSYLNPFHLIYELYCPISAHVVLFASCIMLFQHMLSYLQAMSSYFNQYHSIYNLSPPIFKLHNLISSFCIILFSPLTSSYLQLPSSYLQLIL